MSIFEGALAVVFINWSTGVVTTGYALWLGADPLALAILGALPTLGQFAAPLSLIFRGSRKRLSIILAGLGRALFGLVLFLPLFPTELRMPGLLLIMALSQLIIAPVNVLWTSWMAELVPEERRGRYFGLRNGLLGLVGTLGNLVAGGLIDALGKPQGFLLVLAIGVVAGVSSVFLLKRQYETPSAQPQTTLTDFIAPLKDRRFVGFLGFVAFFMAAVMVGGPFIIPLWLEYIRMSFAQIGLWTVISASCGLIFTPLWGRFGDRFGHMQVLFWSGIFASILPIISLLANPKWLTPVWFAAVIDAMAWGGIGTALTNTTLASAPKERRNHYLSLYWVAFGLGGVLGASIGGGLGKANLGPSPYHLPIVVSALLRLMAVLYLRWRIKREAEKAKLAVGQIQIATLPFAAPNINPLPAEPKGSLGIRSEQESGA